MYHLWNHCLDRSRLIPGHAPQIESRDYKSLIVSMFQFTSVQSFLIWGHYWSVNLVEEEKLARRERPSMEACWSLDLSTTTGTLGSNTIQFSEATTDIEFFKSFLNLKVSAFTLRCTSMFQMCWNNKILSTRHRSRDLRRIGTCLYSMTEREHGHLVKPILGIT
jgi:hypothetical protein